MDAKRLAFDGIDLLHADERTMRAIRGGRISMIMQDPKFSLNPVITVGEQIVEAFRVHAKAPRREARAKALAMLEAVRIRDPEHVFDALAARGLRRHGPADHDRDDDDPGAPT